MSYVMMPDGTSLPVDDVDVDLPDEVYAAIAAFALRGACDSRQPVAGPAAAFLSRRLPHSPSDQEHLQPPCSHRSCTKNSNRARFSARIFCNLSSARISTNGTPYQNSPFRLPVQPRFAINPAFKNISVLEEFRWIFPKNFLSFYSQHIQR